MTNTKPALPETGFVRLREILTIFPVSRSQWWKGVKDGNYPPPYKLGPKLTAWRAEDIRDFLQSFKSEHELKGSGDHA